MTCARSTHHSVNAWFYGALMTALLLIPISTHAAESTSETSSPSSLTVIGTLRAKQTSILGAQVSGRIAAVLVDVGDQVTPGQELIRLDPVFFTLAVESRQSELASAKARLNTLAASLSAAKAQVEASEAELADAELNLTRMRALWEKPAGAEPSIPKRMFDEALTRARTTQARLASAKAMIEEVVARTAEANAAVISAEITLRHAEQNLRESVVRAPYAGVITKRMVDAGGSVTNAPATDLMEMQEVGQLYLECALPQESQRLLRVGAPLTYTFDGISGTFTTTITTIFPMVDSATRSIRIRAVIDNAESKLKPGMLASVTIK